MKFVIGLFIRFYKIVVWVICAVFMYYTGISMLENGIISSLIKMVMIYLIYCAAVSQPVMNILYRLFNYDPFAGMAAEQRRFNQKYNAYAAKQAQKDAQYREDSRQRSQQADEEAYARYQAREKAAWHDYQAKQYAGTNDGEYHKNMANKYRNDGR